MGLRCHACSHEFTQEFSKCPRCGMAQPEIKKNQTNYQGPIPVPEKSVGQTPQEQLRAEIEYLSKKLKLLGDESTRLNQDLQKLHHKKEAYGAEMTHVVTSRMKGHFAIWKALVLWSIMMAVIVGYLAVYLHLGSDKYINERLEKKFSEETSSDLVGEVLEAASKAMLEKDVRPEVDNLKNEIREYKEFMSESRTKALLESTSFSEEVKEKRELLKKEEELANVPLVSIHQELLTEELPANELSKAKVKETTTPETSEEKKAEEHASSNDSVEKPDQPPVLPIISEITEL